MNISHNKRINAERHSAGRSMSSGYAGVMSNSDSLKFYFRILVLVSVALYVGWAFLPYAEYRIYSPEVNDLMRWSGYGAFLDRAPLTILWYGSLLAYGVVCIGLIHFKSWARECFLLLTVLLLLSTFVYGINITTEIGSFYGQILNLIDGLIIAMIYFSKLRDEFTVTHNKRMQTDQQTATRFADR